MAEQTGPFDDRTRMRGGRTGLIIAAALGVLALLAFLVLGYRAFTGRLDSARKLDTATARVEDADRLVVEIDAVVRSNITPDVAEKARGAIERTQDARKILETAIDLIDEARPNLNDDERERAALLRASAVARREMLVPASTLLDAKAKAAAAIPLAQDGWDATLEGDSVSDDAVNAYNKRTKAAVTQSQRLNKQAASSFARARERFGAAEEAFPPAAFETYLAFVDTRIRLNRLSQQSDAAWLAGDLSKANALIDEYNKEDRRAVAQAKALPASPAEAITDAYSAQTKAESKKYYRARDEALAADKRLKEY